MSYEEEINAALNADTDLSREEYAKKCAMMDESTKQHGVEGEPPITEEERHKRIQSNFYATVMNILINMYQLLADIAEDTKGLRNGRNDDKN